MITLRDYQVEAVEKVRADWESGILNTILVMATGLGKTESFLGLLARERAAYRAAGKRFRACIVAHREELILQPAQRIDAHWLGDLPRPGLVMGGTPKNFNAEIIACTVQSFAGRRRVAKIMTGIDEFGDDLYMPGPIHMQDIKKAIREGGSFTHLIIDECHHAVAATYKRVIRFMRRTNPMLRHLGVTATPKRADEVGLIEVYQNVSFRIDLRQAIEVYKALVPFVGFGFVLPVSLKGVRVVADDYVASDVARLLKASNIEKIIIDHWQEKAGDRQTMVFTATVEQAYSLASAFRERGITAEAADGKSARPERRAILRRFLNAETQVIVNCALWTEGVDAPPTSCIVMACMTRSDRKYIQCMGRGLRKWPGKTNCIVLDFAPLDDGRDVLMAGDVLGVPRETRVATAKAEEEGVVLDVFGLTQKPLGIDAPADQVQVRALNYFGEAEYQWTYDGGLATLGVNMGVALAVVFPQEDRISAAEEMRGGPQWSDKLEAVYQDLKLFQVFAIKRAGKSDVQLLGKHEDWGDAAKAAELYAQEQAAPALAKKTAAWRNQPASPEQIALARRLGTWQEGMNRGQVAQAITHGLAARKLAKEKIIRWRS